MGDVMAYTRKTEKMKDTVKNTTSITTSDNEERLAIHCLPIKPVAVRFEIGGDCQFWKRASKLG